MNSFFENIYQKKKVLSYLMVVCILAIFILLINYSLQNNPSLTYLQEHYKFTLRYLVTFLFSVIIFFLIQRFSINFFLTNNIFLLSCCLLCMILRLIIGNALELYLMTLDLNLLFYFFSILLLSSIAVSELQAKNIKLLLIIFIAFLFIFANDIILA